MHIWRKFKRSGFIFLFVVNIMFLSSFTYISKGLLNSQTVLKTSTHTMDLPTPFPEFVRHTTKQGWNPDIKHKITKIGDVNDSFEAIYELVNPQTMIENGFNGENVTIAILDSGINEVGWITNLVGSYTTVSNSELVDDDNGHGTLVASIISMIAPAANLISIRVTDKTGFAETEWVEEGLELALSLNASIIHASLGTSDLEALNSSIFSDLSNRNISTVFSAGNEGPYASSLSSPAIFAETIAVGMLLNDTYLYPSSSSGPRPSGFIGPDLVAPGVEIVGYNHEGKVTNNTGSSFAAPFVTGALALLKEAFPEVSPIILKAALLETAHFINNSAQYINNASPIKQGNGLLDISKAYQRLQIIDTEPLFTFTPRKLSSDFPYYGHSINGVNRTYSIGLYSTINTTLTQINTTQEYPTSNATQTLPFEVSAGTLPRNINVGLN
ncbi:MAG: S8 family peptidase, partial [Candidatus Heimdallarchaeota archaeon]